MATVTLRLRTGPDGKQTLTIGHESDPDSLAHEHEEDHQAIANRVIEGGIRNNPKISKTRGQSPLEKTPNKGHELPEQESVSSKA